MIDKNCRHCRRSIYLVYKNKKKEHEVLEIYCKILNRQCLESEEYILKECSGFEPNYVGEG